MCICFIIISHVPPLSHEKKGRSFGFEKLLGGWRLNVFKSNGRKSSCVTTHIMDLKTLDAIKMLPER